MSVTERDAVTEAFTDEMKERKDGVLRRKQKEYYRYLVGSTALLCAGQHSPEHAASCLSPLIYIAKRVADSSSFFLLKH